LSNVTVFDEKRNDVIHATGVAPSKGEAEKMIKLAYTLHDKKLTD